MSDSPPAAGVDPETLIRFSFQGACSVLAQRLINFALGRMDYTPRGWGGAMVENVQVDENTCWTVLTFHTPDGKTVRATMSLDIEVM